MLCFNEYDFLFFLTIRHQFKHCCFRSHLKCQLIRWPTKIHLIKLECRVFQLEHHEYQQGNRLGHHEHHQELLKLELLKLELLNLELLKLELPKLNLPKRVLQLIREFPKLVQFIVLIRQAQLLEVFLLILGLLLQVELICTRFKVHFLEFHLNQY